MKYTLAEYIESGTFQGGEEDTSKAQIKYGEEVYIVKKTHLRTLVKALRDACAEFDESHSDPDEYPMRQDWAKALKGWSTL